MIIDYAYVSPLYITCNKAGVRVHWYTGGQGGLNNTLSLDRNDVYLNGNPRNSKYGSFETAYKNNGKHLIGF